MDIGRKPREERETEARIDQIEHDRPPLTMAALCGRSASGIDVEEREPHKGRVKIDPAAVHGNHAAAGYRAAPSDCSTVSLGQQSTFRPAAFW
jgi:hypothetical protein